MILWIEHPVNQKVPDEVFEYLRTLWEYPVSNSTLLKVFCNKAITVKPTVELNYLRIKYPHLLKVSDEATN